MSDFDDIHKRIRKAIRDFNKKIPDSQRAMYDEIVRELRRLDLRQDAIKPTVANLKVIISIKNKISRLILTDEYLSDVKEFLKSFNDITRIQNEYWRGIETRFKITPLMKQVKAEAISETSKRLTQSLGSTMGDRVAEILRVNVTTGGSLKSLENQLRKSLTDGKKRDGLLTKNVKQVTVDSINQFNAQYTQLISNDLGLEWFAYQGSEIMTSRPFCQHMAEERRYFHVSEIPDLLRAKDMTYVENKDGKLDAGERKPVRINPSTNLPYGFYPETDVSNFIIYRGGYQCGHIIRPVPEFNVRTGNRDIYDRVVNSEAYKRWKADQ